MSKPTSQPSLKMLDLDSVIARLEKEYPFQKPEQSGKRSKKASTKSKTA